MPVRHLKRKFPLRIERLSTCNGDFQISSVFIRRSDVSGESVRVDDLPETERHHHCEDEPNFGKREAEVARHKFQNVENEENDCGDDGSSASVDAPDVACSAETNILAIADDEGVSLDAHSLQVKGQFPANEADQAAGVENQHKNKKPSR